MVNPGNTTIDMSSSDPTQKNLVQEYQREIEALDREHKEKEEKVYQLQKQMSRIKDELCSQQLDTYESLKKLSKTKEQLWNLLLRFTTQKMGLQKQQMERKSNGVQGLPSVKEEGDPIVVK